MPPISSLIAIVITAGAVAIVLLWPHVRSGPRIARMAGEVFVTTLALCALAYCLLLLTQHLS